GTVPLEDIIWGYLAAYFIVLFYEHFFESIKSSIITHNLKVTLAIVIALFSLFLGLVAINADILRIPYFYLKGGVLFLILPSIIFLSAFPKYLIPFSKTALFFFFINLLYELTALALGYWTFPGEHYIGWTMILSHKLPYEEI